MIPIPIPTFKLETILKITAVAIITIAVAFVYFKYTHAINKSLELQSKLVTLTSTVNSLNTTVGSYKMQQDAAIKLIAEVAATQIDMQALAARQANLITAYRNEVKLRISQAPLAERGKVVQLSYSSRLTCIEKITVATTQKELELIRTECAK